MFSGIKLCGGPPANQSNEQNGKTSPKNNGGECDGGKSELDNLITAFTAPMPNQKVILTDYEAKKRKPHGK